MKNSFPDLDYSRLLEAWEGWNIFFVTTPGMLHCLLSKGERIKRGIRITLCASEGIEDKIDLKEDLKKALR